MTHGTLTRTTDRWVEHICSDTGKKAMFCAGKEAKVAQRLLDADMRPEFVYLLRDCGGLLFYGCAPASSAASDIINLLRKGGAV